MSCWNLHQTVYINNCVSNPLIVNPQMQMQQMVILKFKIQYYYKKKKKVQNTSFIWGVCILDSQNLSPSFSLLNGKSY